MAIEALYKEVGFPCRGERLWYLDVLKTVAAFAMVMTHIASIGWQALPVETPEWLITSIYEIVTRFCVPAFFMCSGALLLNPNKKISSRSLVFKYIGRTAGIALLVSLLYCGLIIYLIHPFFRLIMESLDIFSPIVDTLYTCPLIAVPVVSAVIWLLSFIAALVLKLCVSGMRTLYFKTAKD